ncbi:hypothetical protein BDY19DRAFT_1057246 [Irpex rosettiformis]|uniref:Uncharacterized protein n=1 Tax=Irpex rosettiformis TaxID=378272 RepID=A0ACB8U2X6_9APHY|nr:hypothetical protein BDY19DRAFT_1057246 [Irpex rosettiformis]
MPTIDHLNLPLALTPHRCCSRAMMWNLHDYFSFVPSTWWTMPRTSLLIFALAVSVTWAVRFYQKRRYAPPGPPQLPLLGNILQIPSKLQFTHFSEWEQEYGAIYSLNLLGQNVVVVNTFKAAGDLFGTVIYL